MMRQVELVERVQAYNPDADEALLNKAYVYAMRKHGRQKRASGDPYIAHPLEVAAILTDLKLDDATIAVALLHDTIEDTDATRAEIEENFGPEIGSIVEGLTKIDRLNLMSRQEAQAENLRKLLLAIAADVRVLLVKLADRLHNMRTLKSLPPEARSRIAEETMEIYAPLAGRMGMQDMRTELEDLAFQTLQPEHFKAISKRLNAVRKQSAPHVARIEQELTKQLKEKGIAAEVGARLKRAYSIFRKMERKSVGLEQLSDIIGFRVVVDTIDDCYRALGVVHSSWSVVPGRFKDYISNPKQNGYRSIHTTIVGPGRQRVELQIRTRQMHEIAEFGIAAHALYKDGVSGDMSRLEAESRAYGWLRSTIAHLTEGDNPEEFLEHTKLELFQDQVFCFTPRGRLIALPRGATPIDFAYAVHTEIGDACVGAKINGSAMPLITVLRNGDEVEIVRDPAHVPPPNWEGIAITGKARAAIRRAVREAAGERALSLGEQIYAAVIDREAATVSEPDFKRVLDALKLPGRRELMVALGDGAVDADTLAREIWAIKGGGRRRRRPLNLPVGTSADGWFSLRHSDPFKFRIPGGQRLAPGGRSPL
ncbi:MAG: RelA/SpoT family protein, partial [Cucumibacter sp.]